MHPLSTPLVLGAILGHVLPVVAQLPPPPPRIYPSPNAPGGFQLPCSRLESGRVCTVPSESADAGPHILAAAHECNNGGIVYFPPGKNYTIATALDLTFLKNIDFAILGHVSFSDDIGIWPSQTFHYSFQSASMFWRFGGSDVNIYGAGQGVIDGRGQTYWTAMAADSSIERPALFGTDGLHRATVSGLTMTNPPGWCNLITNSTNILLSDIVLDVSYDPKYPAKNTDAFDTLRSSNVVIQNSVVVNTDDCVSFKPNSTQIVVQSLKCTGSHGISVGSLGQYQDEIDIVEDIFVYNISMNDATDAARIKVWPGATPDGDGASGGGQGRVRNITYELVQASNVQNVVSLTQCYGVTDQAICDQYPSSLTVENVLFSQFSGTAAKKYDPRAGYLICSSPSVCNNIKAMGFDISEPSGQTATYDCVNVDTSLLELNCVA